MVQGYFRDYPTLLANLQHSCTSLFVSTTEIICVSPAMPMGSLPVEVTLNGFDHI